MKPIVPVYCVGNTFVKIDMIYTEHCDTVVSGSSYSEGSDFKSGDIQMRSFREMQHNRVTASPHINLKMERVHFQKHGVS